MHDTRILRPAVTLPLALALVSAAAPDAAVLTDDHAPVDRLMQHVLENDL